jgi:hypothetical protein
MWQSLKLDTQVVCQSCVPVVGRLALALCLCPGRGTRPLSSVHQLTVDMFHELQDSACKHVDFNAERVCIDHK